MDFCGADVDIPLTINCNNLQTLTFHLSPSSGQHFHLSSTHSNTNDILIRLSCPLGLELCAKSQCANKLLLMATMLDLKHPHIVILSMSMCTASSFCHFVCLYDQNKHLVHTYFVTCFYIANCKRCYRPHWSVQMT